MTLDFDITLPLVIQVQHILLEWLTVVSSPILEAVVPVLCDSSSSFLRVGKCHPSSQRVWYIVTGSVLSISKLVWHTSASPLPLSYATQESMCISEMKIFVSLAAVPQAQGS